MLATPGVPPFVEPTTLFIGGFEAGAIVGQTTEPLDREYTPADLFITDIDRDGARELVAWLRPALGGPPGVAQPQHLAIWPIEGAGLGPRQMGRQALAECALLQHVSLAPPTTGAEGIRQKIRKVCGFFGAAPQRHSEAEISRGEGWSSPRRRLDRRRRPPRAAPRRSRSAAMKLNAITRAAMIVALWAGMPGCQSEQETSAEPEPEPGPEACEDCEIPPPPSNSAYTGAPTRNFYQLSSTMEEALNNLSCSYGPRLKETKDYGLGATGLADFYFSTAEFIYDVAETDWEADHIQSLVYTGPFSDGTARFWSSRSDVVDEANEIFRHNVKANRIDADGTPDDNTSGVPRQDTYDIAQEDHVAQLEWLPDWDSETEYEAGYLFVAAAERKEVLVHYYHKDTGGDPTLIETDAPLARTDGGNLGQVYITYAGGKYWLAMGQSRDFEVHVADALDLFPDGAGSLDPDAFEYHGTYSVDSGGGSACHFVADSTGAVYRLCFDHDTEANCEDDDSNGDVNTIYANRVRWIDGTFRINPNPNYSVTLGHWGSDSLVCVSSCVGLKNPTFRASGTLYVDSEGHLNVYSLAFGGKDGEGCLDNTGTSPGRLMACEEP